MIITKTLTLASKILNDIYFGNSSSVVTDNLEVANKHQSTLSLQREVFVIVLCMIDKSLFSYPGGSPYPGIDARQIARKLQEGFRMPKPRHVDDKL